MSYQHQKIEKKWQKYWEDHKTFKTKELNHQPKFYALDMFPYPSGAGLHVGHPEGYTATDIISRFKRMQGYNVMHPMGWDAFGLPAEQYALQTGNDPRDFTAHNIETFKRQIKMLGLSYDWDREINTSDPAYYRWTQWIFIQLYKKGLAELRDIEVNWCEALGTVLANEEIINLEGKMVSERGFYPVEKKPMKQWVLKITEYAERLLNDLEKLDWPESIKEMQRHWIGKSEGAIITFTVANATVVANATDTFQVFTTRPDTIFGVTYCVLAPEHILVKHLITDEYREAVNDYIQKAKAKSDLERSELNKEKTGVFTGSYAINPVNQKLIPIWIADYVLASYGTKAVMAVPAHDERDFEFASKYQLPIIKVLDGDITTNAYTSDGVHINSDFLNGLMIKEANEKIISYLSENKIGERAVNYRLRDWVFSRQRYWGEPFPIIHYEDGTIEAVSEDELPVELPVMKEIKISGTGESPLANASEWLEVIRADGVKGRRETNTMPQWAGSCWYYLAYLMKAENHYLPLNDKKTQDIINAWLPVDLYIGGAEHAVLHLLYVRFWHKVLYDCGIVNTKEPFQKLFNQGMILGEDGVKMSKSWGNVINPDDIVEQYGADTLRVYEMFMGPLEATKPWSTQGVEGARRFLERVYRLYTKVIKIDESNHTLRRLYHQTIKKVSEDYENLRFNTAIAQMMIFINEAYKNPQIPSAYLEGFLQILNPIAPHITEELRHIVFKQSETMAYLKWPSYDEDLILSEEVTVVVQVNGKLRDKLVAPFNASSEEIKALALALDKIKPYLENATIQKIIVVPQKIVNIVVK